jgi:hypothetical protein
MTKKSPILGYADSNCVRGDLPRIQLLKQCIEMCITIYLLAVLSAFAIPIPTLKSILEICILVDAVVASVLVAMLSVTIDGSWRGIELGILSLIPLFGLLAMFIVDEKAKSILRLELAKGITKKSGATTAADCQTDL